MMKGKLYNNIYILVLIGFFGVLAACSDPIKDQEEEEQQAFEDSLAQATIDAAVIETYISDNGLDNLEGGDFGIKYGVTQTGVGEFPEVNDIVSVHYIGKSINNEVFDTSIDSLAIALDSLSWVEEWTDSSSEYFGLGNSFSNDSLTLIYLDEDEEDSIAMLALEGLETSEVLTELNSSLYPLDMTLYSSTRDYDPITYNQINGGTNLSLTNFIFGFKSGLDLLSSSLNLGAEGVIILPSITAYGSTELSDIIVANSVLIFEFEVDTIRYQ